VVVVESASGNPFPTEDAMTLALIFAAIAVIFACYFLYTLATLALPLFAAVTVGMWVDGVDGSGSGLLGAVVAGLVAGVLTLIAGQLLFALVRSPLFRLGLGLMFAIPAAIAGYHAVHGITGMGVESEAWRHALGLVGALFVGGVARIEQASPSHG